MVTMVLTAEALRLNLPGLFLHTDFFVTLLYVNRFTNTLDPQQMRTRNTTYEGTSVHECLYGLFEATKYVTSIGATLKQLSHIL